MFYPENDTELSWLVKLGAVCEENQIGQWYDQLYRRILRFIIVNCHGWSARVSIMTKNIKWLCDWSYKHGLCWNKKMNYRDLPDQVRSVMKTIKDNDVIDHVDAVWAKNKTELSWLFEPSTIVTKIRLEYDVIDHIDLVQVETKTELLGPI